MASIQVSDGGTGPADTCRVLVVDDEAGLAAVVADALEHVDERLQTSYTTEPREALQELRARDVDCLVTDYEMPGLDGLGLIDRDDSGTPFVLFTQRREQHIVEGVHERGGEYLTKDTGFDQYRQLATLVRQMAD